MNRKIAGLGALASAGLASICCIGPLLATGLGLGGLGFAAGLTHYRPWFLAITASALAAGFYQAYRRRPVDCPDGSCELRSGSRAMKATLWSVALLAAALATFPRWSGCLPSRGHAAAPAGAKALTLKVSGMDCAACAAALERSVEKVPGVYSARVDFDGGRATVMTDDKADPEAVIKAVTATGYKAKVVEEGSHGGPHA